MCTHRNAELLGPTVVGAASNDSEANAPLVAGFVQARLWRLCVFRISPSSGPAALRAGSFHCSARSIGSTESSPEGANVMRCRGRFSLVWIFAVADLAFLALVAAATTAIMHFAHGLGLSFPLTFLLGMSVAMGLQTLMALAVAPLLGSIESMVPSMIVGMLSPMGVCTLDILGVDHGRGASIWIGMVLGALCYFYLQFYGHLCRRELRRSFTDGGV